MTAHEIESMGKKNPITGNVTRFGEEAANLNPYEGFNDLYREQDDENRKNDSQYDPGF